MFKGAGGKTIAVDSLLDAPLPIGLAITLGGRAGKYINSAARWNLQLGVDAYGVILLRGSLAVPITF